MARSRVIDTDRGFEGVKRRLRAAKGLAVKVGVLGGEQKDGAELGTTVAEVAMWNEFGVPGGPGRPAIPSRPAFRRAAEASKPSLRILAKAETAAVIDGTRTPQQALGRMGLFIQGAIQQEIVDLRTPPNAPSTIAAKGSSNPLIDTGQLKNSVTYEVVETAKARDAGRIGGRR